MAMLPKINKTNLLQAELVIWDWSGTIIGHNNEVSPEVLSWIKWFYDKKIEQGIISNEMNSEYLFESVKRLGLWDYFDEGNYVLCSGQNHAPKPSVSMFKILLDKFQKKQVPVDKIFYIGDSLSDQSFAEHCGCAFCFVDKLGSPTS